MVQTVRRYRDLDAWQAAMDLAVAAHGLANVLPPTHRFELADAESRDVDSEQHC